MIFNKKEKAKAVADKLLNIDEVKVNGDPKDMPKRNFFKPYWRVKHRDEYNTKNYSFEWMFFNFWTLDQVSFEFTLVISDHWGIGFIGLLPYLRWGITIPMPLWMQRLLWKAARKPEKNHVFS